MSNLILGGLGTNSLITDGLAAASSLVANPRPIYQLKWDGETDRLLLNENGPLRWKLTRTDGAGIDAPDVGVLNIYDAAGALVLAVAPDVESGITSLALAQLVTLTAKGLYHARLEVTMPDGTVIASARDIYVI